MARPDDPEYRRLLGEFVPLRIVNLKGIDLNLFRFDTDLTFAVLLMNADGYTYSRFGVQDHTHTTDRMSLAGLKQAMRDVLVAHRAGDVDREAIPDPAQRYTLLDLPAFARSRQARDACYHCHFEGTARFRQLRRDGQFRKEMFFRYPYPENLGITLEVDRNNVVKSVQPGSPAARAGIRAGDRIVRAGRTPIFTTADLQFALDPVADPGSVTLTVQRDGRTLPPMTLSLSAGWRRYDVSWRASVASLPPILGIWGRTLTDAERRQRGIAADRLAILVTFLFPEPVWEPARRGIRTGDVIVAIDGEEWPNLNLRQFHSTFRLKYNVGDRVRVTLLRGNQRIDTTVDCIDPDPG